MVKVEKGEYVLKINVRNEKRDIIEKMVEKKIIMNKKMNYDIYLDV